MHTHRWMLYYYYYYYCWWWWYCCYCCHYPLFFLACYVINITAHQTHAWVHAHVHAWHNEGNKDISFTSAEQQTLKDVILNAESKRDCLPKWCRNVSKFLNFILIRKLWYSYLRKYFLIQIYAVITILDLTEYATNQFLFQHAFITV